MLNILALGDVVGHVAIEYLQKKLWSVRQQFDVRFCVANGENATDIHGLSASDARALLDTGVDLITLGNHAYSQRDLYGFLDSDARMIRPANYPALAPGRGYTVVTVDGWRALVINVSGRVFMDSLDSPFDVIDRVLEREHGSYDFSLMDIHAEATSEKLALARYFDGRISLMFGTHTHVMTADEQILPGGSAYITDIGMTGPIGGILGTASESVIAKFRTNLPQKFTVAGGSIKAHGILFSVDPATGKALSLRRIIF